MLFFERNGRAFVRVLCSETLNTASTSVLAIAAPLVAISALGATVFEVAMLAAASSAAPLFFGLSVGPIVDRLDHKRLMIGCSLARLLCVLIASVLFVVGWMNITVLAVIGFALSAVKLLFDTVMISAMPAVVARSDLTKANSWYEGANSAASTGAPATAGWLLQLLPAATVYIIGACLYLLSTTLLKTVSLPTKPNTEIPKRSHWADIADSVRILWDNRVQRVIAIAAGIFNFFHSAFFAVFAHYAITQLKFDAASYGTMLSFVGAAGLLAALFAPRLVSKVGPRGTLVWSLLSIGPLGVPLILLEGASLPYQATIIVLCFAVWDFMIVLHLIVEQTIRQVTVDSSQLGRVSSTTRFVSWGADPIGALSGGLLASTAIGSRGALAVCLVGFLGSGATLLFSRTIAALPVSQAMNDTLAAGR
ncbi:MFS transporter [Achromobacter aloeverae]|uniref:MFS transporter n=1 Tax=Achromobacter aloeverae TaxID=1750518 RepID=A0A4Q1HFA4_9BURK|nr:MFS transporter [Achromobacter aloeverae]RXN85282.1 hypothetical protein C7R54_22590 [Achromobacter aloeverae]